MQYKRSNRLLQKKFTHFLLPTMITYTALSLNQFVDSMLVSNMLGSDSMAIIGLGTPLMLVMAAVYNLLGSGGSTIYAMSLGRRDHETAGRSLTASVVTGLVVGVLLTIAGKVFFGPVTAMLCHDAELMPQFQSYFNLLLFSAPFLIAILVFTSFLPAAGYPTYSTVINVASNIVNLVMDIVYIHVFGMGIVGAGWATVTGYVVGFLLIILLIMMRKMKLVVSHVVIRSFETIGEIIKKGAPDALTQIGFALQFAVVNGLAGTIAGTAAIVAFSLCIQCNSVVSIFEGAMIGASVPFLSVLHGQRDYRGEEGVLKTSLIGQVIVVVVSAVMLEIFAPQIAAIYNITDASQAAIAIRALRIYALTFVIRGPVILYFRYLIVIGFNGFASFISALDGFGVIVPAAWILSHTLGLDGLWSAFPVSAAIIMTIIIIHNARAAAQSNGRLKGLLLLEHDDEVEPILDVTITKDSSSIAGISETLQKACEENGLSRQRSVKAALAVEEMAVYAANKKTQNSYMDILARIYKGNVEIDFRSLGTFYDPFENTDADIAENVSLLRGVASKIENEYILGMNSTRITISGTK
ncbi:MAG: hypothetical protein IJH41_01420 [Eubacterium sp.]|nr:hypothetical protein [Eubacterium sp.]